MAARIDGRALAVKMKGQTAEGSVKLPRRPGLTVVRAGEDPAAKVYAAGKARDCAECGIERPGRRLSAEAPEESPLALSRKPNQAPWVDDILVQLPLPGCPRDGAVIGAAMNRNENDRLCGDADYASVVSKAAWITPVPGGAGPMTRARLMHSIPTAARLHQA